MIKLVSTSMHDDLLKYVFYDRKLDELILVTEAGLEIYQNLLGRKVEYIGLF